MKIERMHIRGFGRWVDRVFEFPAGLSVWVGLNEAGKTTLVHAILAGLYGLAKRRTALRETQDRYRPWDDSAPFAVTLQLAAGETKYRIERDFEAETVRAYRKEGRHYLAEEEPEQLVARLVGLSGINLFRSTLLVTQGEVAAVQEGKPGEAVAAKAVSGDDATTAANALRFLDRELHELSREGRTDATRSAMQRTRLQLTQLEETLAALEEAAEREDNLLKELDRLEQEITEKKAYQDSYGPLVQKYDQYLLAKDDNEQGRQRLEELVKEFAGIERNRQRWEEVHAVLTAFAGQPALTSKRRKAEEALWLQFHSGQNQELEAGTHRRRLEDEIRALQMQLSGLAVETSFGDRPSREGWVRFRELTEQQRKVREELQTNLKADNEARRQTVHKMPALAGIVAGIGLILPPLFFKALSPALFALLILPAIVIIGFSIRALVLSSRTVQDIAGLEGKIRGLQAEADRLERELRQILAGRSPEEYLADLETDEAETKKALDLGGRLTVLRAEDNRLKEEGQSRQERLTIWNDQLGAIWREAGVEDHGKYLAQCEKYDQVVEDERLAQVRLEQSLRGKTLADWDALITGQTANCRLLEAKAEALYLEADPLTVESHRQNLTAILEQLPPLVQEREIRKDRLRSLRENFDGIDRHKAAAELARLSDEAADQKLRAAGIQLAKETLGQAWDEVNTQLTPVLIQRTADLFSTITDQRYSKLRVADGANPREEFRLEAALPGGGWAAAEALSSGTCDQLYIALRIALGEYLTGRADFPLILDDPFIHFDPVRLNHTVQLLKELSSTHQIIWLTKEPRISQDFPELFVGETSESTTPG